MQHMNVSTRESSGEVGLLHPNATPSTPRVDLYRLVHKGLRSCLFDTLLTVGRMDVHDDAHVAHVCARVRQLLALCHAHLEKEDRYIHPALEQRRPGSTWGMAHDHVQHERMFARLENHVSDVVHAGGVRRAAAAQRLYDALAVFVAENLEHMRAEETSNNEVLWESHSDAELTAIHAAIVRSIVPDDMHAFLRWMVPAMSPVERAQFFAGMRSSAPAAAVASALAAVEPHLSVPEWTRLRADLAAV